MECYVFPTQQAAQACIDYINGTPWFPIVGEINGVPAPDCQKTDKWMDTPLEIASGGWAVVRIPMERLDALNVSQQARDQFLAAFGQDVREIPVSDFVAPPPIDIPIEESWRARGGGVYDLSR